MPWMWPHIPNLTLVAFFEAPGLACEPLVQIGRWWLPTDHLATQPWLGCGNTLNVSHYAQWETTITDMTGM